MGYWQGVAISRGHPMRSEPSVDPMYEQRPPPVLASALEYIGGGLPPRYEQGGQDAIICH